MPATADIRVRRRFPLPVVAFVWAVLAAALLAPIAHGCHGGDEDHEPVVVPDVGNPDRGPAVREGFQQSPP